MQTSSTKQPAKQAALSRQKKPPSSAGLGSAVAETLVRRYPVRQEFVGIQDTFGQSGKPADLLREYKLNGALIAEQILEAK